MDTMAWFREYLRAHQPDGQWREAADCAVRACLLVEDAAAKQFVVDWADSLIEADACTTDGGKVLFAALAATGDDKYRAAIEGVMARIGRDPAEPFGSAEAMYAVLPFRMAYEMKLGGMEKVGLVAARFRENRKILLDTADLRGAAYGLLALADAINTCADQLYEHWRAMVDIYRDALKAALAAELPSDGETAAMIVTALHAGVRMNLIDPERYLPIADKWIRALKAAGSEHAAAMLEMEGGAL